MSRKRIRNETKKQAVFISASLRLRGTPSEYKLFDRMMELGIVFKFQKEIMDNCKFHIADFYFGRGKLLPLVVEIDGGYHLDPEQMAKDEERSKFIVKHSGAEIIRFTNEQVDADVDAVIEEIKKHHVFIQYQT